MRIMIQLMSVPEGFVTPEEAKPYLTEFILFLKEFLYQMSSAVEQVDVSTDKPIFDASLISYLNEVLVEAEDNACFDDVIDLIKEATDENLSAHGLEGAQLTWKITIINSWILLVAALFCTLVGRWHITATGD